MRRLLPALLLSTSLSAAQNPVQVPGSTPAPPQRQLQWTVLNVQVPSHVPQLRVKVNPQLGTDADLFLKEGAPPTLADHDAASRTPGTSAEELVLNGDDLSTGTWYMGVRSSVGTTFGLEWHLEVVPAEVAGMGANIYDQGTSFRLWAPHATGVSLVSSFNGWAQGLAQLADEGNGHWSLDYRDLHAGETYRFAIQTPNGVLWKNDPRVRQLESSVGAGIVIDPDSYSWQTANFSSPAWNDLVIYELHIGTFFDTPGGTPGDFASAASRLDYLADLGVNAIEVMPIWEFAGDYSWGYNGAHPFSVESIYGGVDQFKFLVDEAHARGIAVFLDVLYNHWGPSDMDLWQFDGWNQNGWGGIYFYNDERAITPWGDTKPDYGRNEVRQYIRDNVLFWLQESQADGLRWDGTSVMRMGAWGDDGNAWSLMQWINDEVNATQPWKMQIAEDMFGAPNDWITKDTGAGGAGFDGQWDALFVHPIRHACIEQDDNNRNMWAVRDAIAHRYNTDAFERVIYTESHDEVANGSSRVPEEIWPGNADSYWAKKRSTLGASIVFTSPGVPMMFQGQEILEDGFFQDTDPVDWTKLQTHAGIHAMYKDMIRLRRNLDGVSQGLKGQHLNVHHVNDWDKVIAFHRWDQGGPGDDVIVISNFRNQSWSDYRIGLPRPGTWKVRFNSDWDGYDAGFSNHPSIDVQTDAISWDGMPQSASLSFGPYTTVILSQ